MGLWLKCPACQVKNPLDSKVCAACGASLTNLPAAQRLYVLETGSSSAPEPKPSALPAVAAATAAAPTVEVSKAPVATAEAPKSPGKQGKTKRTKKKKA